MLDVSNYLKAGYGCIFVETTEIKRCSNSIITGNKFNKYVWNFVSGLSGPLSDSNDIINQLEVINFAATTIDHSAIILENYDLFLKNPNIMQTILNNYNTLKYKQVCLIIVGSNANSIPIQLRELIPIIQFDLPTTKEIQTLATELATNAKQEYNKNHKNTETPPTFDITSEVVDSCRGLSMEEIENILAKSMLELRKFDTSLILKQKRKIIQSTGFMDFYHPEPIENLGGLVYLKNYLIKRMSAFKKDSNKPKIKSILVVGYSGTGKSLCGKTAASLFGWPGIQLDIGALKGGIVGETESNVRTATRIIDGFGKCIILVDEIEKSFGNASDTMDSGVSQGMLGYFLTWMQDRTSEGILFATCNDLSKLPPEFLRAGRWDAIFFVDLPNQDDTIEIIKIMNQKYKSNLPISNEFIDRLVNEGWSGAEIEQLAKDYHFDEIDFAMEQIPILAKFKKTEMEEIRKKGKQFRIANDRNINPLNKLRKITLRAK